jgi:hypothetical protein
MFVKKNIAQTAHRVAGKIALDPRFNQFSKVNTDFGVVSLTLRHDYYFQHPKNITEKTWRGQTLRLVLHTQHWGIGWRRLRHSYGYGVGTYYRHPTQYQTWGDHTRMVSDLTMIMLSGELEGFVITPSSYLEPKFWTV